MKGKNDQKRPPLSSSMVEDRAAERLKKRLKDLGLIVNAGAGKIAQPAGKKKGVKK
jgi:tetrahydromethanopterin S-methyltransferase subunit G